MKYLLIDADGPVHMAANAATEEIDWDGSGDSAVHEDFPRAQRLFSLSIQDAVDHWPGYEPIVVFSSPDRRYWRHDIFPDYKGHRGAARPLIQAVRDWAKDVYKVYVQDNLEADDLVGILATGDTVLSGRKVVVSIDKDMRQIPGTLWNPRSRATEEVTPSSGDRWHLYQTLVGDATDGYPGIKGVGHVKAERFIEEDGTWEGAFELFAQYGFDADFALLQARLARILRAEDWSWARQEIRLWEPPSTPCKTAGSASTSTPVPSATPPRARGGRASRRTTR